MGRGPSRSRRCDEHAHRRGVRTPPCGSLSRRSGAAWRGTDTHANPELFALTEQHLHQFNQAADETVLTAGLLHTLETLRILAQFAARVASDHHGWRGRVAFWWLSAIAAIAQAAYALLSENHSSYVQEKLTTAVRCLRDGVSEGAAAGLVMAHPVMTWFIRFPFGK